MTLNGVMAVIMSYLTNSVTPMEPFSRPHFRQQKIRIVQQ